MSPQTVSDIASCLTCSLVEHTLPITVTYRHAYNASVAHLYTTGGIPLQSKNQSTVAATIAAAAVADCQAMSINDSINAVQYMHASDLCSVMQSAALDCILPHSNHGVPLSVARTLVHLAIPFIILAAFCTAWILAYACLQHYHPLLIRGHVHGWLQRRLKVTCYSVLGYFYPSLTQATLSDLQCLPATQLITPYLLAHCTSPF